MADKKISELTAANTPLTGVEQLPIVQSNTTTKATVQNILNLSWKTPISFSSGRFYYAVSDGLATSNVAVVANILYGTPIYIPELVTILTINLSNVNIAGAAGTKARIGLYKKSNTGDFPSSLVVDGGEVATDSTGTKTVTVSTALTPGWYFMAVVFSGTPTILGFSLSSGANTLSLFGSDVANASGTGSIFATITSSYTYGALPSTFPTATYVKNQGPRLCIGI